jgi:hypothetical protein
VTLRDRLDRLVNPLHLLTALVCTWLVLSSPWVGLYDRLPDRPGPINLSHAVLGAAALPLGLAYFASCVTAGRWRQYFPWLAGQFGDLGRDLAGIARGEWPGSEGGGLFATIEGLLLFALMAAAATGALWFLSADIAAATAWRGLHLVAARAFVGLMGLHVLAVSLHLLDFVRD